MSTIKTLRDALESIAGLYEDNADANSIRQASLLYDSRCIARTALTEAAAKDAPALEAVRDKIGQVINDELFKLENLKDYCDSREIDRIADAVLAAIKE